MGRRQEVGHLHPYSRPALMKGAGSAPVTVVAAKNAILLGDEPLDGRQSLEKAQFPWRPCQPEAASGPFLALDDPGTCKLPEQFAEIVRRSFGGRGDGPRFRKLPLSEGFEKDQSLERMDCGLGEDD